MRVLILLRLCRHIQLLVRLFPILLVLHVLLMCVETMEASFKDAGGGPEWANAVFSDVEFWYAFLEQSVQLYAAMVDEGRIDPPPTVLEACIRINDMQERI